MTTEGPSRCRDTSKPPRAEAQASIGLNIRQCNILVFLFFFFFFKCLPPVRDHHKIPAYPSRSRAAGQQPSTSESVGPPPGCVNVEISETVINTEREDGD